MQDLRRDGPPRELTVPRKHRESNTMLAIVMAGVAGLFIIAIASAYHYASSESTALGSNPPPSAGAVATRSPPETTGSGSSADPLKVAPDHSMKQR